MKSLNTLFKDHAQKMRAQNPQNIMRGMFFDCQGTLFDYSNNLQAPLVALMRISSPLLRMPPYIISAHLSPYIPAIKAEGLHEIATLDSKLNLAEHLRHKGQMIEFLIDDQPMFGINALTTIHPSKLLELLEPEISPNGKLANFMKLSPAP